MFGLGATELIIILAIVVLLFGARRLPEIGSGLGKAIKGFRSGMSDPVMSEKGEIDVTHSLSPSGKAPREGAGGDSPAPREGASVESPAPGGEPRRD